MPTKQQYWETKYDTGIDEIDSQHKYIWELVNTIDTELNEGSSRTYLINLFEELSCYAQFHFLSEGNIRHRLGYPTIEQHEYFHQVILLKLSKLINSSVAPQLDLVTTCIFTFLSNCPDDYPTEYISLTGSSSAITRQQ